MNSEARGILYGENEPEVIIGAADCSTHASVQYRNLLRHCSIPLFYKRTRTNRVRHGGFRLWCGLIKSLWLKQLHFFHSIRIRIDIGGERGSGLSSTNAPMLLIAVNHLLYSLCAFIATSPNKRSMSFKVSPHVARRVLVTDLE